MRSYEAARGLFSFMSFVGWVIIIGGALAAVAGIVMGNEMGRYGYGRGPGPEVLLFMLPGVGIALVGVITLALSEIGRAGVDTAEYSQQMLQLSRDSLEVSRQSLRQGEQMRASFEALKVVAPTEPSASYADLRTAPSEQKTEPPPNPTSAVGYANRSAEPALAPASETPALHAPTPKFDSPTTNGSKETAKST